MPRAPLSDGKTFFMVFTYIWEEDVAKISKLPRPPRNINLARSKTWLVSVTNYCTIFNSNSPPSLNVARGFRRPAPLNKKPMKNNVTKKLLFLQLQFLLAFRVQQYTRKTVIKNNLTIRGPRPFSPIFANQIKSINRTKLRVLF